MTKLSSLLLLLSRQNLTATTPLPTYVSDKKKILLVIRPIVVVVG